ncbi:MAG TPA: dihydroorotate dehydrogenase-like protein [Spirochaetia bacterium]|nr:dihydroorotate dehydrogenase-like protein [Spirochaetia bacterium]
MSDLSTSYLGLKLKNPLIVSSSSMTQSLNGVKKCAEHGAAAVVLKSLFEEQIEVEVDAQEKEADVSIHPEAQEYVRQMGMRLGPNSYLDLIRESKSSVDIPIIASVNCVDAKWWGQYAKQIQSAGADALELNISIMPRGLSESAETVEKQFTSIVQTVRQQVDLPLAVKIGPYFSSLPKFVLELEKAGASAVILFNRFYQLDIDLRLMKLAPGYQFSSPNEMHVPLRWISILSDKLKLDLAASTGVHDGDAAAKMLLAGAAAVQICSTLFLHGFNQIQIILNQLEQWMKSQGMNSVEQFRGRLSQKGSPNPEAYERFQYIKALTGVA